MPTCPSDNSLETDQSSFWSSNGMNWDAHRIGWAISGGCSVLTVLITLFSVYTHARNYHNPAEQRQIIRILYMPPVYAVISFFSYRFFRDYTYYELIEVVYEAVTISAFLLLIIEYVSSTASDHSAIKAMQRKDKRALPLPFCCWRYRPTKPYFMYTVKWAVMQYVIVRPLVSVVGIICQALDILCENGGFNFHFAYSYLEVVDFISITVALYGLLVFYGLTHDELSGRRPLAKFLCIKLIVMFTFYQSFVFSLLEGRVIKATQYWTATNIANGLTALTICIEMVLFSGLMLWAYPASEYRDSLKENTNILPALWDSINYSDFIREIWSEIKFFIDYARKKPGTHSVKGQRADFGEAFGVAPASAPLPYNNSGDFGRPGANSNGYDNERAAYNVGSGQHWGSSAPALKADEGAMRSTAGRRDGQGDQYADDVHLTAYGAHDIDPTSPTASSERPSDESSRVLYPERPYGVSKHY